MLNRCLVYKDAKQIPQQLLLRPPSIVNTFSPDVYPSAFPIQLREDMHSGRHLLVQHSPQTPLQDRARAKPISPSPLISWGFMVQPGMRQAL